MSGDEIRLLDYLNHILEAIERIACYTNDQMRNAIAHGYFKVDMEIVWKTIQNNLPILQQQIQNAGANLARRR